MNFWKKSPVKNHFNQTLWHRIRQSSHYIKTKRAFSTILIFVSRLLSDVISAIVWVFWDLPKQFFKDIIKLFASLGSTIKNIPTLPKRIYLNFLSFNKSLHILFIKQNYLRKKLLKYQLTFFFKYLFLSYFILSFLAEIQLHTNHEFAHYNEFWVHIYSEGYKLMFAFFITSIIILILTWYFINWISLWKINKFNYIIYMVLVSDLIWTWFYAESINMLLCTFPVIIYFWLLYVSWDQNEWSLAQNDDNRKKTTDISFKTSWETYHFFFKLQEEKDKNLKKYYINKFREWRLYDRSQNKIIKY